MFEIGDYVTVVKPDTAWINDKNEYTRGEFQIEEIRHFDEQQSYGLKGEDEYWWKESELQLAGFPIEKALKLAIDGQKVTYDELNGYVWFNKEQGGFYLNDIPFTPWMHSDKQWFIHNPHQFKQGSFFVSTSGDIGLIKNVMLNNQYEVTFNNRTNIVYPGDKTQVIE